MNCHPDRMFFFACAEEHSRRIPASSDGEKARLVAEDGILRLGRLPQAEASLAQHDRPDSRLELLTFGALIWFVLFRF